jgi:tRNA 2-thiouridine synthesizing protein A
MSDVFPMQPLDLRGLKCPLPALRTRKALQQLPQGGLLIVECTDPMSRIDIPHLVHTTGNKLELSTETDNILIFHIRRA